MRFMILLKADKNTEAGVPPSTELIAAMMKYNEELTKAGVLLAGEGLQPSSKGTRVKFSSGRRTVTDGPFPELRELIAGFWMLQVNSKEEAIDWVKRCPDPVPGGEYEIEIRQVFETSDFETMTPELKEKEEELRAAIESRQRYPAPAGWSRQSHSAVPSPASASSRAFRLSASASPSNNNSAASVALSREPAARPAGRFQYVPGAQVKVGFGARRPVPAHQG
jgi:hypothetical protein